MSLTASTGRAGDFASSSRPRAAEHADFIWARHAAGVPTSAIANMIGCNVVEVKAFIEMCAVKIDAVEKPRTLSAASAPAISTRAAERERKRAEKAAKPEKRTAIILTAVPIIQGHADRAGISLDAILSKSYPKILGDVRNACWADLYATGRYSLTQIGGWFGRHHTSILTGIAQAGQRAADVTTWRALGQQAAA